MKQSFNFEIESVVVNAAKIPVTIKGIKVNAECEYSAEEMAAEGAIVNQVIDKLAEKFGWLKPLIERKIEIELHNDELLSKDFEKKIEKGTQGAYGPRGWYAKTETVETEEYDPNKDYSHKVETTKEN